MQKSTSAWLLVVLTLFTVVIVGISAAPAVPAAGPDCTRHPNHPACVTTTTPPPTTTTPPPPPPTYSLVTSESANRAAPSPLDGATVEGTEFIFTTPDTEVTSVQFLLDGVVVRTEGVAPFDFAGGSVELANPWDTTAVTEGLHTIRANLTLTSGSAVAEATFTVDNVPATTTTTPPPPPPPPLCTGTTVAPGSGLKAAMDAAPSGTTFCLQAGTYTVSATIVPGAGDTVAGAGRDATFIDGSPLPETNGRIFYVNQGDFTVRDLDIGGTRTPPEGQTTACINHVGQQDYSACGRAFTNFSTNLTITRVDCHDNGGNCVGGNGNLNVDDLDCWNNGNAYSMATTSIRYAACIKQVAVPVGSTRNDVTIRNSNFHDNIWNGIWCDFCRSGTWIVENNTFRANGGEGFEWEMSGGWGTPGTATDDNAQVRNNFFTENVGDGAAYRGAMHVSTANDILIENNTFLNNLQSSVGILFSANRNPPQPDSRGVIVQNNTLNGDPIVGCSLAGVVCTNNT